MKKKLFNDEKIYILRILLQKFKSLNENQPVYQAGTPKESGGQRTTSQWMQQLGYFNFFPLSHKMEQIKARQE